MNGMCTGLVDAVRLCVTASLVCLNLGFVSLEGYQTCEAIFWKCRHTSRICPDHCIIVGVNNNDACIVDSLEVGWKLKDCLSGGCWSCPESRKCNGTLLFGTQPGTFPGDPCTCAVGC
jgi:hypothetical protein